MINIFRNTILSFGIVACAAVLTPTTNATVLKDNIAAMQAKVKESLSKSIKEAKEAKAATAKELQAARQLVRDALHPIKKATFQAIKANEAETAAAVMTVFRDTPEIKRDVKTLKEALGKIKLLLSNQNSFSSGTVITISPDDAANYFVGETLDTPDDLDNMTATFSKEYHFSEKEKDTLRLVLTNPKVTKAEIQIVRKSAGMLLKNRMIANILDRGSETFAKNSAAQLKQK